MPQGNDYLKFTSWWLSWERLGTLCGTLKPEDWIAQFDQAMHWRGFFTKYLKEILECQLIEPEKGRWTLQQRCDFIRNKTQVDYLANQTIKEHEAQNRSMSQPRSSLVCHRCGKEGHYASECRSTARIRPSGEPGRSYADAVRSDKSGLSSNERNSSSTSKPRPSTGLKPWKPWNAGSAWATNVPS